MHGIWRCWAPPMEVLIIICIICHCSFSDRNSPLLHLPVHMQVLLLVYRYQHFLLHLCIGQHHSIFTVTIFKMMKYHSIAILGAIGVAWTFVWFMLSAEKPSTHRSISVDERKYVEETIGRVSSSALTVCLLSFILFHLYSQLTTIPWKSILTSLPVYAIMIANFCRCWTFYLLLQNQLTYMKDALGMDISSVFNRYIKYLYIFVECTIGCITTCSNDNRCSTWWTVGRSIEIVR